MLRWNTVREKTLMFVQQINVTRAINGKPIRREEPLDCHNGCLLAKHLGRSTWPRFLFLTAIVAIAAFARLIPHPSNVSPVGAIALFGGAFFPRTRNAFLVSLPAMLLSDLMLGFHVLVPVVYGCFALNVLLGRWLRPRCQFIPIALATVAGAVQFFIITNFTCWVLWYPHTLEGLCACYIAAIPFFHNTVIGDAVFTTMLFGGLAVAEAAAPIFREEWQTAHTCA